MTPLSILTAVLAVGHILQGSGTAQLADRADFVFAAEIAYDTSEANELNGCAVGEFDDFLVRLTTVQISEGYISFHFEILNTGIQKKTIQFYGQDRFGNGGSSAVIRGREILATGVEVAGQQSDAIVAIDIIPNAPLLGRVEFDGIYAGKSDIQLFRFAYGSNKLRPDGTVDFLARCLPD